MADPLSIAASVAGLLSLADSVFRGVFRYSREVSDAQRDIKALRDELQSVASVLHGIKLLTETLEQDAPHASFLRLEHIHSCRAVLKEIQSRISKSDPSPEGNKRMERAKQSLKWPFGKSRTSEMVNELSRQKGTLQLALQADTMADLTACLSKVQSVEDKVNQIHQKVESLEVLTRIRMDELHTKILDYFMVDDPSPNLRTAWNLRQPLTGLWLTESPRFREWLMGPQSKLWLSGIPGAGKTILAGAAIREALSLLESSPNIGVAYFFCDYKKKSSWDITNILQVLLAQLGRQKDSAFEILEEYYNKIQPRVGFRTAPDVEDLRDLLVSQVGEFDLVLVVVDGLDECGDKAGEVSSMLSEIAQFATTMSMALFSRHEADISDHLETKFDHISIAAHTEDISLYVGAELEKRIEQNRLRLGDAMLKDEIKSSLIEKAQGMFRWVACQLDALSECPTDADRKAALQEMPKDLPETYERILHRINQRQGRVQRLARLSLKLIAVEDRNFRLSIQQLCQAVSTPDTPGATLEKQAIVKDEEISRICSSFIRRSVDGNFFEFSHFSVREYLQDSSLLQRPELALYHVSNEKAYHAAAVQCLRFLLLQNFEQEHFLDILDVDEELILKKTSDEFPLYRYAAVRWPTLAHYAEATGMPQSCEILDLEKELLHPKKSIHYQNWLVALCVYLYDKSLSNELYEDVEDIAGTLLYADISTLHIAAAFNRVEVGIWLIENGALSHSKDAAPTVLDFAVAGIMVFTYGINTDSFYENDIPRIYKSPDLRQVLLAWGGKISDFAFWSPLTTMFEVACKLAAYADSLSSLQCILDSGWQPKPEDISTSQLYLLDHDLVDEKAILDLVCRFNSAEFYKSELGHQLCALIWDFAIKLDYKFTANKSLFPTEITMSYEALRSTTITAIENGDMESLTSCGHDPRFDFEMTTTDEEACSLLHVAVTEVEVEALDYLLSVAGCNIDKPDRRGKTPLHYAVKSGNDQLSSRLIEAGASLVATDDMGWNVFHHYAKETCNDNGSLRKLFHNAKDQDHNIFAKGILNGRTAQDSILSEISSTNWQSINVGCCNEKACVWEIAASRGSADVLRALIDVDFPRHLGPADRYLFHSIPYDISSEAFDLLKSQFPSSLHVEKDEELPVMTFLSNCLEQVSKNKSLVSKIDVKVIRALLDISPPISSTLQQALEFCCGLVRGPASVEDKKALLAPFLDYGFDMHPTAPYPSILSQACQSFPFTGEISEARSLMSLILDHVVVAKFNQLDSAGFSILHTAYGSNKVWLLSELIRRGADLNVRGANPGQSTPLVTHIWASSIGSATLLLKSGADPTIASPGNWNAIQTAVCRGSVTFLREVIQLEIASPFRIDWTRVSNVTFQKPAYRFVGLNALHLAVVSGSIECFDLLVNERKDARIHSNSQEGYSCIHFAAWCGDTRMIEHLHKLGVSISRASADGTTPVHMAVRANKIEAVRKLLDLGSPLVANIVGITPSILARRMGFDDILVTLTITENSRNMDAEGGVVNDITRARYWQSAMEGAIQANDYQGCVRLLSDNCPVDISLRSCGSCSPLLYTLKYNAPSYARLIVLFLSHSASVSKTYCKRHGSGSALENAMCLPRLGFVLPKMLALALKDNWACVDGTLITRIIQCNNTQAIVILLAHLKNNRAEYAHFLGCSSENVVSFVINAGGNILVHHAVWHNNLEVVKLLVNNGADVHASDVYGRTPLHICRNEDIARYLLGIGATPTLPPWHAWYGLSSESIESLGRLGKLADPSFRVTPTLPKLFNRQLLSSFISDGANSNIEDDPSRSIVHHAIYNYPSGSMALNGPAQLNGTEPFPWHQMCYPIQQASWIGSLWRHYRRRFDIEDLRHVTNLHPSLGWSPMCLATCTDDTRVMAHCLELGADINFEGSPYGSALMAAAFSNRLDSVKFLVRNGATICYEGKQGFKSAVVIGWRCQRVTQWLIRGRFTDQGRLGGAPEPNDEVKNPPRVATGVWSSMVVPLRLLGYLERQPHESSLSYLQRLAVIKRAVRGRVVPLPRPEVLSKLVFTATYSL